MANNFCLCQTCDAEFLFGALDTDQDCAGMPLMSQVAGLLIVPDGAGPPDDWTVRADWEAVIDQDSTDNSFGKYLTGIGSVAEPEKTTITVAKGQQVTTIRLYTLVLEVYNLSNVQYLFLLSLQCNPLNYQFWIENVSGHLWGGASGISPTLTDVDFPLGAGEADVEKAVLTIEWRATCDPPRTYIEGLSDNFPDATETSNILGFAQGQVLGYGTAQIFGF